MAGMKAAVALIVLASALSVSCIAPVIDSRKMPDASATPAAFHGIRLLKKAAITTDAEGGSARPEVAATKDRVFVVYLGGILRGETRFFGVKVFDENLEKAIAFKRLVSTTPEYGGPTDIRIASDTQYLYAFYETYKPTSPDKGTTYLWGAKYTLDDGFKLVAQTGTPIANSRPMVELPEGGELLDDPAPLVGRDSVFVVTRLKHSLGMSGKTAYLVREFDRDLTHVLRQFDLDLSDAAHGRARVCSLLRWNDSIYVALPTTASDRGLLEGNDDGALSDIILVRMSKDWTFDRQKDVRVISAEPGDRENYVSGFAGDGNAFYVAYKQSAGSPPAG